MRNGKQVVLGAILALILMAVPGICMAEPLDSDGLLASADDYDAGMAYADGLDTHAGFWRNGFSLTAGAGVLFAPINGVSSGYRYFKASSVGIHSSLQIGYNWDFFTLSFDISPQAGWLYKESTITDGHNHTYPALEKGRWDGYFMSIGLKFDFAIKMTEELFMNLGFGFDLPMGVAVDREMFEALFRMSLNIGAYQLIADQIAIGFKLLVTGSFDWDNAQEGDMLIRNYKASAVLVPAFSLIYHP